MSLAGIEGLKMKKLVGSLRSLWRSSRERGHDDRITDLKSYLRPSPSPARGHEARPDDGEDDLDLDGGRLENGDDGEESEGGERDEGADDASSNPDEGDRSSSPDPDDAPQPIVDASDESACPLLAPPPRLRK